MSNVHLPSLYILYLLCTLLASCSAKVSDSCGQNQPCHGKNERCILNHDQDSPSAKNLGVCLCKSRYVANKQGNCVLEEELKAEDLTDEHELADDSEDHHWHSENMHKIILLIAGLTTVVVIGFVYVVSRMYLGWRRRKYGKRQ